MRNSNIRILPPPENSELLPSQRLSHAHIEEGMHSQKFSVSIFELFSVLKSWVFSKFRFSRRQRDIGADFCRPRSGNGITINSSKKMNSQLGLAKYRKDIRNFNATHRK